MSWPLVYIYPLPLILPPTHPHIPEHLAEFPVLHSSFPLCVCVCVCVCVRAHVCFSCSVVSNSHRLPYFLWLLLQNKSFLWHSVCCKNKLRFLLTFRSPASPSHRILFCPKVNFLFQPPWSSHDRKIWFIYFLFWVGLHFMDIQFTYVLTHQWPFGLFTICLSQIKLLWTSLDLNVRAKGMKTLK